MKITAEFNSKDELLSFVNIFGDKTIVAEEIHGAVAEEVIQGMTAPLAEPSVEEPEKEEVTLKMVKDVFQKLVGQKGTKVAKELTLKYGASKLSELEKEHYTAVLKEAEELLNG